MFKQIKFFIKQHKFEYLITFFVFTNLFPAWFPQFAYYIAFALILYKMSKFKLQSCSKTTLYYVFIVFLWLSTMINMVLDLRLVLFSVILFMTAPRLSIKWHLYKIKLMYCIFSGFGIATIANLYAKFAGINHSYLDRFSLAMGRVAEFSGFCSNPMWTSCAAAFSTLFFVSMAFRDNLKKKSLKYFYFAMILASLYVTMIGASRSAFFLSLACSVLIIWMQSKKIAVIRNLAIVGVAAVIFAPFLMKNSQAMMNKKNGLEITTENTSRDELWGQRMEEFKSSPIWGIGFAAHGVGANKQVGRNESGGSFISVLAQAGIIGIIFVLLIWVAAIMIPKAIGIDYNNILFYASFVFMSVHSILEGYMFQAGWYLCLIIWFIIGLMIEHKMMRKKYPLLMKQINI